MATRKYLTLAGLTTYDTEIKEVISAGDAAALASAKSYTDQKLTGLTGGTIVVKKAEHATKADSATTADSVAWGNVTGKPSTFTPASHTHDDRYYTESEVDSKISTAVSGLASTSSVNTAVSNHNSSDSAHGDIRSAIAAVKEDVDTFFADADFTTNAKDTLKEIQTYIDSDAEAAAAMTASINGKADKATTLAGYGITNAYTKTEVDTALSGKAAQSSLDSHTGNTTVHIADTERTNWNAAKTHANSPHAPSNAQPNQNAFSNVKVGATTVAADTITDTIEFAGTNVTITPDATNDKITFVVATGSTSATGIVKLSSSTSSNSETLAATPKAVKSAYDLANTAQSTADGAATTANEAKAAAATNTQAISANTSSINGHTTRISNLETKVGDGFEEITTAEIQALFA